MDYIDFTGLVLVFTLQAFLFLLVGFRLGRLHERTELKKEGE